jgi:hypothetical protein
MTALTWDGTGEKVYETGVDHGVLYTRDEAGVYDNGFAWNGLVTVTESPTGAESNKTYADNIIYGTLISAEEFGATIEAYTYPDEFGDYDGTVMASEGVVVGQQARRSFGLSYRTLKGNDVDGTAFGYKLHLLYGLTAAPSEKAYGTVNDSPEMITFSWEITSVPTNITDLRPTSQITIDSTQVDSGALAALEALLYGDVGSDPSLPTPDEVVALFAGAATASNVVVTGDVDSIDITGTTANVLFTVEHWDGDEWTAVTGGTAVNEVAAEALVLANGIKRVSLTAAAGNYIPAAQVNPFLVNVT